MSPNALIVGHGSIGQRHLSVLKKMGADCVVVTRRDLEQVINYPSISEAMSHHHFDYVVIASKTSEHLGDLVTVRDCGYKGPILVEKPIFSDADPTNIASDGKVFVGYNLRYLESIIRLSDILANHKILSCHAVAGKYLPDWRPNRKYYESYSAKRAEGGGVLLDLSHEIDFFQYLFGALLLKGSRWEKVSSLDINVEDIASVSLSAPNCPFISLNLDYLDHIGRRVLITNTETSTFELDLKNNWLKSSCGINETFMTGVNESYQRMHVDIMSGDSSRACSFAEGVNIVRLVSSILRQ